ncbi:MAG: hypothetical protein RBT42_13425 [Aquabacterium sp.]|jgi:hypothetical protein|uniref:hypothetical protein n=1 Tax=Aquabacterium sp. TaxID=1872578 RepID=UPI002A35E840|nr:hypothetical protein [Aquabacterium sp.]MDX9844741.1 hypothetical protein [Aquabacterium sp.]
MSHLKPPPIQRDWVSKTLAGTLLGFTLAIACSGVFAHLTHSIPMATRAQLAMWMVAPIWLGTLSGVYAFASGPRAWLWLSGANLVAFGSLGLLRLSQP